jgi:hypothetical protein
MVLAMSPMIYLPYFSVDAVALQPNHPPEPNPKRR